MNPFDLTNYATETFESIVKMILTFFVVVMILSLCAFPIFAVMMCYNALKKEQDRYPWQRYAMWSIWTWLLLLTLFSIGYIVFVVALGPWTITTEADSWMIALKLLFWPSFFL